MKNRIASILLGGMILLGTWVGAAAATPGATPSVTQVVAPQPAADASLPRSDFTQRAMTRMQVWRQQLDAFDARAAAEGQKDSDAAEAALKQAWPRTQAGAAKLETASAEDWAAAKAKFQDALNDFGGAWKKFRAGHDKPTTP